MRHLIKISSPNYGLALIVVGVVTLIASHMFECAYSNVFSLFSALAVLVGIIVYVKGYRTKEKY
jgi:uncharacterized membrane protein